ncbi:MAG: hypothetical protein CSA96_02290 [Bacteroidetes bacterium]|nr:MAG: hypothetical protein CSA96_02290 [Bacteroidota bacterium]
MNILEKRNNNWESIDNCESINKGYQFLNKYNVLYKLRQCGAQAELYLCEYEDELYVVKLYRELIKFDKKIIERLKWICSLDENELLFAQLTENTTRVSHNAYNLEVLLALASLERYTMETVYNLARIEGKFEAASEAASSDPEKAMDLLLDAHKLSEKILRNKEIMWSCFNASWYKSRLPKNQSKNGIEYLYVLDDVKDHFADRRKGLEYMLAPFERMKIEEWKVQLEEVINEYAKIHDMPPL